MTVTANFKTQQVCVRAIGSNPAGVNGLQLEKNQAINVENESIIELLLNSEYRYTVKFDPVRPLSGASTKKKNSFETDNTIKKIKTNVSLAVADECTFKSVEGGLLYAFTKKGVKGSDKVCIYNININYFNVYI